MPSKLLLLAPLVALALGAGLAQAADEPAQSPGVVQKVESAVTKGAQAAASGVERGVRAAASGVAIGVKAAASGVERGARAVEAVAASAARKAGISASAPASGNR